MNPRVSRSDEGSGRSQRLEMDTVSELRELAAPHGDIIVHLRSALANENAVACWTKLQQIQVEQLKTKALHTKDMEKNRYKDVLPYRHARVILRDGGYINASEIRDETCGPSRGSTPPYIACQGPLKHTSGDFWDMIIERDIHDVVMLTGLVENGREKCYKYFEMDGRKHRVRCLRRSSVGGVDVRELEVQRGSISHRVTHYQLMNWPDHGVPTCPDVLDPLLDVLYRNAKSDRTTVVHCSAGIGRSGVLIALSVFALRVQGLLAGGGTTGARAEGDQGTAMVGTVKGDDRRCCSFVDIVAGMRNQRSGMVQTPIQLKFCIDAARRLLQLL